MRGEHGEEAREVAIERQCREHVAADGAHAAAQVVEWLTPDAAHGPVEQRALEPVDQRVLARAAQAHREIGARVHLGDELRHAERLHLPECRQREKHASARARESHAQQRRLSHFAAHQHGLDRSTRVGLGLQRRRQVAIPRVDQEDELALVAGIHEGLTEVPVQLEQ